MYMSHLIIWAKLSACNRCAFKCCIYMYGSSAVHFPLSSTTELAVVSFVDRFDILDNTLNPSLVSSRASRLLQSTMKESVWLKRKVDTSPTEKQVVALCSQLKCLPATDGIHESFIRRWRLSPTGDPHICMRTQTQSKRTSRHGRQMTLGDKTLNIPRQWPHTHVCAHTFFRVVWLIATRSFNWTMSGFQASL